MENNSVSDGRRCQLHELYQWCLFGNCSQRIHLTISNSVHPDSAEHEPSIFSNKSIHRRAAAPATTQHEAISPSTAMDIVSIDLASANTISSTQNQPHQNSPPFTTGVATPNQASTNPAISAQSPPQSSSPSIAIGVGIGVPLGIAVTGFLGILFAHEARLKKEKTKVVSPIDKGEVKASVGGPMPELDDKQRPLELRGDGVSELPGTAAQIVPKF